MYFSCNLIIKGVGPNTTDQKKVHSKACHQNISQAGSSQIVFLLAGLCFKSVGYMSQLANDHVFFLHPSFPNVFTVFPCVSFCKCLAFAQQPWHLFMHPTFLDISMDILQLATGSHQAPTCPCLAEWPLRFLGKICTRPQKSMKI